MVSRRELRHSRDLIEKIEARLSYQRRLVSSNTLDDKLQMLSDELLIAMERRLSHMQVQHALLKADFAADGDTMPPLAPLPEASGLPQPRP